MERLFKFSILTLIVVVSLPSFGNTYTEVYKCKFLQDPNGPPKPDKIILFYYPLSSSEIVWTRPYYKESFNAENIYSDDDPFIKKVLLSHDDKRIRAFKLPANGPVSTHFMRFIILLDSIQNKELISGVWLLTSRDNLFTEEKIIGNKKLNCKIKN